MIWIRERARELMSPTFSSLAAVFYGLLMISILLMAAGLFVVLFGGPSDTLLWGAAGSVISTPAFVVSVFMWITRSNQTDQ